MALILTATKLPDTSLTSTAAAMIAAADNQERPPKKQHFSKNIIFKNIFKKGDNQYEEICMSGMWLRS